MRIECIENCPLIAQMIESNTIAIPWVMLMHEDELRDAIEQDDIEKLEEELEPEYFEWFMGFRAQAQHCSGPMEETISVRRGIIKKRIVNEIVGKCGLK